MGGQGPATDCGSGVWPLNESLKFFAENTLAANTKKLYEVGEKKYQEFCSKFRISKPFPATEHLLCYFAVYLADTVKYDTIRCYFAGLKNQHLLMGYRLQISEFEQLQYVLRGIKRSQSYSTRTRLPITPKHLEMFYDLLQPESSTNFDNVMLWAAICLAYFGFLRVSEFTSDQQSHPGTHLSPGDIKFVPSFEEPQYGIVYLKKSKTDPYGNGTSVTVTRSNSKICAVKALQLYLARRKFNEGPMFFFMSGEFLTPQKFTKEIRSLLSKSGQEPNDYASHSFRIGAATAAANANLPEWLIKMMGRWTSDCYQRYIKKPTTAVGQVSTSLINEPERL